MPKHSLNSSKAASPTRYNAWRFFALALAEPKLLALALLATTIATLSTVAGPRLLGYLIDSVMVPRESSLLVQIVAIYAGLEVLRLGAVVFHSYLFQRLGQRTLNRLRQELFSHLLALPLATYERTTSGLLGTRLVSDINVLSAIFQAGFVRIFERALEVGFIALSIILIDAKRGLVCILLIGIFSLFAGRVSSGLYRAYSEIRTLLGDFNSLLTESLQGLRNIKLFGREGLQARMLSDSSDRFAAARLRPILLFASLHAAMTLVVGGSMFWLLWFGGQDVLSGRLSVGSLVALITYVLWLFWPIMQIVNEWSTFLSGMAAADRVFELLDWPLEETSAGSSPGLPTGQNLRGHIVFENVWFAYREEEWVLKNFSFEIRPGQKVAICGPTGAGKSSLLALLLRFYTPQRGRILIDGRSIEEIPRMELRRQIGLVQQEVFLFSGSLEDNITLWDTTLPVPKLPDRYRNRKLLEGGVNLSLGERQYLAFLRTLARAPGIWLVDEATSNLDPGLDRELMRLLEREAQGRTILTVAHRLAGVTDSDLILVLNHGLLVEQGSHMKLLTENGLYAKLYRVQAAMAEIKPLGVSGSVGQGG